MGGYIMKIHRVTSWYTRDVIKTYVHIPIIYLPYRWNNLGKPYDFCNIIACQSKTSAVAAAKKKNVKTLRCDFRETRSDLNQCVEEGDFTTFVAL